MEKNMASADILLQTMIFMKVNLLKVTVMEKVNMHGLMEVIMMDNGKKIK